LHENNQVSVVSLWNVGHMDVSYFLNLFQHLVTIPTVCHRCYLEAADFSQCWRHGSVVRTSFCSWRTFPDLLLIYGWRVTTSWKVSAMGQPARPSQPSIPSGSVN